MLTINLISIFPDFFAGPLGLSIPKRAAEAGLVRYRCVDLRDFAHDKHRTVDDAPFGGGPGMVMKPAPFFEAVESVGATAPIVLLSPRGKVFQHADAERFAAGTELTLLCGHYKDVDQRVADHLATEEISLGDIESARTDSFYGRGISAPSYTRPAEYRGFGVPEVLLSGNHAAIEKWREEEGGRRTQNRG
jgi:tRNA (guanine37-N1)-methyltransferase